MNLVSAKEMVTKALKGGYAIGHFDIHNLEWTQAVLTAAEEEKSPVIMGGTEPAIRYFGSFSVVVDLVKVLVKELNINVPVALHLDHGTSFESCKDAIDAGFTSVMIDSSHLSLIENIKITKLVSEYAHQYGISVEAEVGSMGGIEECVKQATNPIYAVLKDCEQLVKQTDIDFLAPALGSVHGLYVGKPKLGFKEMREIATITSIPVVLHGSSGLPIEQIKKAISLGTAKINVNADNHVAFTEAVRNELSKDPQLYDAVKYITLGREALKKIIVEKMQIFGSSGRV